MPAIDAGERVLQQCVDAVIRLRAASLEIERTAPGLIHTDGEPHQADARLVVTVRPQSLRVITPKAAAH